MKKRVTKKAIHGILLESVFNPSDNSPFSTVVAMDDPNYAELKATELISEARQSFKAGSLRTYHDKLQQAVGLLALARAQRGPVQGKETRQT
jgi:hypothetical protein